MNVRCLQIETLYHLPPRMHSAEPDTGFWHDMLEIHSNTATAFQCIWSPMLRQLSILAKEVKVLPMQKFGLLTELELLVPDADEESASAISSLDLVFRHTPMLESISVVGYVAEEIFLVLPDDPLILPNLKSFRLSAETWTLVGINETLLLSLSQFLEQRASLRRLYLRLGAAPWNQISTLLPVIRRLYHLEVLGLSAGSLPMTTSDFKTLASVLTPKMSSVQLVLPWDYPDTTDVDISTLEPLRLKELPRLGFVHLYSLGRIMPIVPDDLASDLVHLHTLGYDRLLWNVEEGCLQPWSPWRVQYAIEEDFKCIDDAWLFKHI
ncbi:hypothetical protein H0H93_007485 [Arthromyces matolae]|nr:hypothetical protein H0H93_007485 [Arthromyces matolae]